jgi:DNA polymerase-3 subunit gamma/tau
MSYTVLARKWRPQTFDEVVGQGSVVQTIKRALTSDRVAHAFLFTGSRGIGKTTLARILAKALVCTRGEPAEPCGECEHCVEITEGRSLDVIEIDGASNTGVDDVRELREVARFPPVKCKFKIFIIDEVHMLSTGAFNALLKTLEEPPPHVKFIFATTEAHKIPVTILSRCQRYDFRRIPTAAIIEQLQKVLAAEDGPTISDDGLAIIARAAEGGMRDALSLADQVLSFAPDGATGEDVAEALGIIDRRSVVACTHALIERDPRAALDVVDKAFAGGNDLKQLVEGVATELRHLSVAKALGSVAGRADLAPDDTAAVDARAAELDGRDLQRLLQMAIDCVDSVARGDQPKLALELAVLRMCDRAPVGNGMAIAQALTRLDALARGKPVPPLTATGPAIDVARASLAATKPQASSSVSPTSMPTPVESRASAPQTPQPSPPPATAQTSTKPVASSPPPEEAPEPEPEVEEDRFDPALGYDLDAVPDTWLAYVRAVARRNQRLAGSLAHGHFAGVEDEGGEKIVWLAFKSEFPSEEVTRGRDHPVLSSELETAYGKGARIEVVTWEEGSDAAPSIFEAQRAAAAAAQQALEDHARTHPVVQQAVELFGGEVRRVRQETP